MLTGYAEGYIARFYGDLDVRQRQGENGQVIESKTVLFSIGSRQSFQSDIEENGVIKRGYKSDFPLFRANGAMAQIVWDNLHLMDQGKLISRHVLIEYEEITYTKDRTVNAANTIEVPGAGLFKVEFPVVVPQTSTIHIVRRVIFLDSNPLRKNDGTNANAQTQTAPVVTPVQNAATGAVNTTPQGIPATNAANVPTANQGVAAPFANAMTTPQAANATGAVYSQVGAARPVAAPAPAQSAPFQGMNVPEDYYMDPNFANPGFDAGYSSGLPTPEVGFGMPDGFDPNGTSAPC